VVDEPALLLLDEPCAQLDPSGCSALAKAIDRIRLRGGSVLLCEHAPEALADRVSHWWQIKGGSLVPFDYGEGSKEKQAVSELGEKDGNAVADLLLEIRDLHLSLGAKKLFSGLNMTLRAGESCHLEGPNGCGKSTLIRVMTGFLPPDAGTVSLFGRPVAPARLRGRVGMVLQNPVGQLFEDTTERELLYAARKKGLPQVHERVALIADMLHIAPLLDRAPHLLSYGQQRLVALGACLVQEPELLILDDPFAGLDRTLRTRVRHLLDRERAERGMALLVTGHNPQSALRFPHFYTAQWRFSGGRIASVA